MEQKDPAKVLKAVENLIDEDRVISFSDAVFAFAATLLVLKIDLPNIAPQDVNSTRLFTEIIDLWPQYLANIVSFLIIAYYWLNHHAIFSLIKKINPGIIWINVIFLIFLSFIPFPVDLFGDYSNNDIVIAFYCLSLSIAGFLLSAIWFYSLSQKLTSEYLTSKEIKYYSLRFILTPTVFALSIPLSFIDPLLSKVCWIFVIVGIILLNNSFKFRKNNLVNKEEV